MSLNETRQKQKNFKRSSKNSGILAMRKFILPVMILLLPVISIAQSSWYMQNSSTSSNLNDIFFINQSTGWAVGDNGTIVKTINGGFSWYSQASGTSLVLRKVQFINSNSGWIVGGNFNSPPNPFCEFSSVKLKTTNGGLNWTLQQTTSLGVQYNDISMIDSSTAFIAGESMDNFQCIMGIGSIGKTTNGGIGWSGISSPISTGFINKSVSFINSFTGYVSALHSSDVLYNLKKILKTTNGGINWTIKTTDSSDGFSAQNNFIRFLNENTGYYINGNFFRTTNSGDNWIKFDSLSVYGMNKFSFLNLNTGYLVGQNKLVKTFNGGTTFITNSGTTFTGLNSVCSNDTNHVWACGAGGKIVYGGDAIVPDTTSIKYFPLKIGNSWTYETTYELPPGINNTKVTIVSDTVINNIKYYKTAGRFPGFTSNLITLDSLTGNIFCYSESPSCARYPQRLLMDSLAGRIDDTVRRCHNPQIGIVTDTSNYSLPWQSVKAKEIYYTSLVDQSHTYGKGFGLVDFVTSEGTSTPTRLKGCIIDGIMYGDTAAFSQFTKYLPLQVGNSWTYKRTIFDPPAPIEITFETVTIISDTTISGVKYYKTTGVFPLYGGNLITMDSLSGNIFRYMENSTCSQYPKRFLLDSLGAKVGNSIQSCPNTNTNGTALDTNIVTIFNQSVKTKGFLSPAQSPIGVNHRYSEKFGLIGAGAMEGSSVTYSLESCTINGVTYNDSLKSISGTIKFSDNNQPASNGYVKALKLNTSTGNVITYDSTQIGTNGAYNLHVPPDLYYIVAYPNSEKQADFIPTYFPSTINWQNAVKVNSANNPSNVNISVHRKSTIAGAYSVNGWITAQTNSSLTGIKDAVVYIKQGNDFKDYFITQSSGQYNLNSLLSGVYEIVADRLGYVSAQQIVSVTNGNLENINFALIRVGITTISNVIPDKFNLYQNYPNPFNPVTNIKFDIPKASYVKINVYNVLGKEVSLLMSENKPAGRYSIDFDASSLTSGVYFYKIETGDFAETKRMVILK